MCAPKYMRHFTFSRGHVAKSMILYNFIDLLGTAMQTSEIDPVLPMAVAAKSVAMHRDTLLRCWRRKELKIIKLSPRKLGVRKSELERWLSSRTLAA